MAIEWIEGFEWLANGETGATLEALLEERYFGSTGSNGANMTAGTNDGIIDSTQPGPGHALKFSDQANSSYLWLETLNNPNEVYLSMRCKIIGTAQNTPTFIQFLSDSSSLQCFGVDIVDDWVFRALRQTTQVGKFAPRDFHKNEWFTIEAYVKVDEAAGPGGGGKWEIRVNGTSLGSATGVDTRPTGASAFVDTIRIRGMNTGGDEGMLIRDLIIFNGTGSSNNTWVGENKHAYLILPNGDTADEDWTLSAGTDSFALIDDVSNDGNTSYIESSTATQKTICDYEASGSEANINGISIHTTAALDAAGSETFDDIVKEGATETNSAAHTVDSTSYKMFTTIYDTNPDTSAAWTSSEVDAVQGGVEKN